MAIELILLPLALLAFAYCARRTLPKLPAGPDTVMWGAGLCLLGLLGMILLLPPLQY